MPQPSRARHPDDLAPNGRHPACTNFGPDRHTKYPGFFFCTPCDNWEKRDICNKRLKRSMKNYKCKGDHTLWERPNTRFNPWSKQSKNVMLKQEVQQNLPDDVPAAPANDTASETSSDGASPQAASPFLSPCADFYATNSYRATQD